jgi:membrane protein implicated in regulation of membrane protease activity
MTGSHPLRALVVAAVGFLGLDAVLLLLAGIWLDRAVLVFWGLVLAVLAGVPIVLWRRYLRQMRDVRQERQAMVQEIRQLQSQLREYERGVVPGESRRI